MSPDPPIQNWLDCLQKNGYRLTAPRQAVVEIIATSQRVLSPFEVFELARTRYPRLGLVTVYRTVEKLEELGLIQRVHQPSGCHSYIATAPGHQYPLICQSCGHVQFISGEKLDWLMEGLGTECGYRVWDHWLQVFGICNECLKNNL